MAEKRVVNASECGRLERELEDAEENRVYLVQRCEYAEATATQLRAGLEAAEQERDEAARDADRRSCQGGWRLAQERAVEIIRLRERVTQLEEAERAFAIKGTEDMRRAKAAEAGLEGHVGWLRGEADHYQRRADELHAPENLNDKRPLEQKAITLRAAADHAEQQLEQATQGGDADGAGQSISRPQAHVTGRPEHEAAPEATGEGSDSGRACPTCGSDDPRECRWQTEPGFEHSHGKVAGKKCCPDSFHAEQVLKDD